MVGVIIIFGFLMSLIINFVERKAGFQDEEILNKKEPGNARAMINKP